MLTRGLTLENFKSKLEFWLKGPEWLNSVNIKWPVSELSCLNSVSKSILLNTNLVKVKGVTPLVPFEKFSKLSKLVRVTSLVIKALSKFKCLNNQVMNKLWGTTDISQCAKVHLIQVMQNQAFPKELEFLRNVRNKDVPELVNKWNLFIDEGGLMRSDGRIGKNKFFNYEVINPILLPKDHSLTKLIIENAHLEVKHLGIQPTLNNIRLSGYILTHPYQGVKKVIQPCVTCKRYNALSYTYPRVTNLPRHRVNMVRPYLQVGVDFTGHIVIKEGKSEKKFYLLIFTCLAIRAIHLELLPDMSTSQFVLAMVRFTNQYGIPTHVYSDNARSFVAGVNHGSTVFASNEFLDKFNLFNIKT